MKKYIIIPIVLVIAIAVFAQPITPSGTRFFKYLFDTPDSYTDQGGKGLRVNSAADALEFYTIVEGITGNYVATIADGTGIDGTASGEGSTYTPTFDPTELDALTWSDGTNSSNIWTFDVSGTDHTMTAGNALMTFSKGLTITLDLIVSGGDITLGTTSIFSGGDTASLNNIDTLNPTTEATIEAAIDTLSNLTSIGTIATGVWQGTDVGVAHGGTGAGTFTDGGVLLGSGTNAITAMSVLADGAIIVGDNSTDPVALTAFTSSTGDLIHEAGGLEADVSGYTDGIYGMASGATLDIDTSAEVRAAIGDETGTGLLVFATAPTFTTSIKITGADADPGAAGVIVYDNTITNIMSGGALRWYDDNSVRLIVDLETDPADDDYVVAYDSSADGFYMKADADSGGATAYDNIENPTAAGSISFDDNETATYTTAQDSAGSFFSLINSNATVSNQVYMLDIDYSADTTEDNADFIRLQDAGSTLIVFEEEGKLTMTPSGVDDATIISIVPSVALTQSDAAWYGIKIDGDALDPGDVDNIIIGVEIDLSGVDTTNNPYVEALELKMYVGGIALHIEEGGVDHFYTIGGEAGTLFAVYDIVVDGSSQAATSETHIIDVEVANGDPDGIIVAVSTHTYVAPIHQHIGTYTTPDQVGADSEAGFFDDSATDYIDGVDGIEQFTFDDDAIWISNAAVFHSLEVSMTSDATRSIVPTFWYWKDDTPDLWTEFHPLDTTEGFQHSGTISWDADDVPSWLSADVVELSAGDSGEAAAGYWIAIVRTVGADPGTPTPTTVKTGTVVLYEWDETGAVDLLSLEADTITEGGNAVWNATETDIIDSGHYIAGSIDYEHLADDVISGAAAVGTFTSGDTFLVLEAGVGLREADYDDLPGVTTAWDDIGDADGVGSIDFVTYTQTIDIGKSDSGGGSGLVLDVTELGNGTDSVVALLITTVTNNDSDFIPIEIRDDSGNGNDLLFNVDADGQVYALGGIQIGGGGIIAGTTAHINFAYLTDNIDFVFGGTDVDIIWSNGILNLRNDEDGIDAIVEIEGKDDNEKGILRVLSDGDDKYIELYHDDTDAHIISSSGDIHIEAVGGNIVTTNNVLANGNLSVGNAGTTAGVLTLLEDDDDGSNFASFTVPALGANTVYILPPDDGDNTEVLQTNGSGTLTWVANAGSTTKWNAIGDADGVGSIDFVTYTQTIDIGKSDIGGGSGLILDVTGLGAGTDDVIALKITTATDDDTNYVPIAIYDDSDTENDLLFHISSAGDVIAAGQVTASSFSGLGSDITSVDAITGDSATAFFDTGTIEHEWGGLQADISGYTGLIAITGTDTTVEIDSKTELEGQIADVADFAEADGDVYSNNHDFGSADLEIPQASPGVPNTDGEIEFDFTDGSLVIQHGSAHAELDSSTDVVVGKLIRCWGGTIFEPDAINDVMTVKAINSIEFPHGVVITAIYLGVSENTSYTLTVQNFDDFDTINSGSPTIDAVTYTANTTGEIIDTSPTYDTIAAGQLIMISIPSTDVDWIHFEIYYYEPAA